MDGFKKIKYSGLENPCRKQEPVPGPALLTLNREAPVPRLLAAPHAALLERALREPADQRSHSRSKAAQTITELGNLVGGYVSFKKAMFRVSVSPETWLQWAVITP